MNVLVLECLQLLYLWFLKYAQLFQFYKALTHTPLTLFPQKSYECARVGIIFSIHSGTLQPQKCHNPHQCIRELASHRGAIRICVSDLKPMGSFLLVLFPI